MPPVKKESEDTSSRSVLNPLDVMVITRERLQDTLDDAVRRGRMTRDDATDLLAEILRRAISAPTDRVIREVRRVTGAADEFPIADYDDLTAAQIVSQLGGLEAAGPAPRARLRAPQREPQDGPRGARREAGLGRRASVEFLGTARETRRSMWRRARIGAISAQSCGERVLFRCRGRSDPAAMHERRVTQAQFEKVDARVARVAAPQWTIVDLDDLHRVRAVATERSPGGCRAAASSRFTAGSTRWSRTHRWRAASSPRSRRAGRARSSRTTPRRCSAAGCRGTAAIPRSPRPKPDGPSRHPDAPGRSASSGCSSRASPSRRRPARSSISPRRCRSSGSGAPSTRHSISGASSRATSSPANTAARKQAASDPRHRRAHPQRVRGHRPRDPPPGRPADAGGQPVAPALLPRLPLARPARDPRGRQHAIPRPDARPRRRLPRVSAARGCTATP